jgi:hypothetical protein
MLFKNLVPQGYLQAALYQINVSESGLDSSSSVTLTKVLVLNQKFVYLYKQSTFESELVWAQPLSAVSKNKAYTIGRVIFDFDEQDNSHMTLDDNFGDSPDDESEKSEKFNVKNFLERRSWHCRRNVDVSVDHTQKRVWVDSKGFKKLCGNVKLMKSSMWSIESEYFCWMEREESSKIQNSESNFRKFIIYQAYLQEVTVLVYLAECSAKLQDLELEPFEFLERSKPEKSDKHDTGAPPKVAVSPRGLAARKTINEQRKLISKMCTLVSGSLETIPEDKYSFINSMNDCGDSMVGFSPPGCTQVFVHGPVSN